MNFGAQGRIGYGHTSNIYPYRNCSTGCPAWHLRGQLGRLAERPGAPWLAQSLPWAPWLARFGRPGRSWLALAGSIWPRMTRYGCPGRSGWLALDAQGAPGSPWLANDCPIDTISKKKSICFSTILLRCCLLRALWNVSSCLKSSICIYFYCNTYLLNQR